MYAMYVNTHLLQFTSYFLQHAFKCSPDRSRVGEYFPKFKFYQVFSFIIYFYYIFKFFYGEYTDLFLSTYKNANKKVSNGADILNAVN